MKIVINKCFGGFGLSQSAMDLYKNLSNIDDDEDLYEGDIERTDPVLVQVVEKLGESASGRFAKLKVIEIPDNIEYYIDDYDGVESVHEKHRSWG